jgi:ATP-dependent RNA helicase DeaD
MPSFHDFSLQPVTRKALEGMGITEPTFVQAEAIPALLAGRDLVGQSATGSGKTLAYSIPLVERLSKSKRAVQALVLVPTRELAVQVNSVLSKLASARHLSTALLVGGRAYSTQISALRYGAQIVVGTPGRVQDQIERGTLVMNHLRICILDEADQMLDSGFAPAIEEILTSTPETRQMALFSATIPEWVAKLEEKFLKDPVKVSITSEVDAPPAIEQIAYQVAPNQKIAALCMLLQSAEGGTSLIFGKTKYGVEKLGTQLSKLGFAVGTFHGNKSQRAREEVLMAFRRGQVRTLLATNVAARGLDIVGIEQVINYELPESSELFTHRIGRTGRMGRQGKAITLLVPSDVPKWRRMARSLGQTGTVQRLTVDEHMMAPPPSEAKDEQMIAFAPSEARDVRPPRQHVTIAPKPEPRPMIAPKPEQDEQPEQRAHRDNRNQRRSHLQAPASPAPNKAARSKQERGRRVDSRDMYEVESLARNSSKRVPSWQTELPARQSASKGRAKQQADLPERQPANRMKAIRSSQNTEEWKEELSERGPASKAKDVRGGKGRDEWKTESPERRSATRMRDARGNNNRDEWKVELPERRPASRTNTIRSGKGRDDRRVAEKRPIAGKVVRKRRAAF